MTVLIDPGCSLMSFAAIPSFVPIFIHVNKGGLDLFQPLLVARLWTPSPAKGWATTGAPVPMALLSVWTQIIKWFISPLYPAKQKLMSLPSLAVQVVVCAQLSLCWRSLGVLWKEGRMPIVPASRVAAVWFLKGTLEALTAPAMGLLKDMSTQWHLSPALQVSMTSFWFLQGLGWEITPVCCSVP